MKKTQELANCGGQTGKGATAVQLGRTAENAVVTYFCARGYTLLARNYSVARLGELDLVLTQADDLLTIVEVKARRSCSAYGGPAAALTAAKIKRLRKTTLHFMQEMAMMHKRVCFLAALVLLDKEGRVSNIEVVPFDLS